ncbi:olfactory receptor 52L1-like [Neosynchiropus ocellatus]
MNLSSVTISFTVYRSLAGYDAALAACILVLYVSCLCVNLLLVLVVCMTARLHRPMHLLTVNLELSGVMGSSAMCPATLWLLLAPRRESSLAGCLTQVFFTNVYGGCVFCTLALMAFDRYVSICRPLRYNAIMTLGRVKLQLLLLYTGLGSVSGVQVFLASRLRLCRFTVDKLACDSLAVTRMSCEQSVLISVYGLCVAAGIVLLPCVLVVLSYVHIILVVVKTSPESRQKALQTCLPHLISFFNFSVASFFGLIYSRVSHRVPLLANVLTSINFVVLPPLLHPLIYGLKTQEIRQSLGRMLRLWTA